MNTLVDRIFRKNQLVGWLILLLIIFTMSMLASFFPLWANVPFNVILPIVLLLSRPMVMFEKLKLSTLLIVRALIVLVLFGLIKSELYIRIVLIFLIINILEATFTDLIKNKMYYNFVTGLFLAASVLCLGAIWQPEVTGPYSGIYLTYVTKNSGTLFQMSTIEWAATIGWIIAYTIWNWLFVIGEFSPSIGFLHIAILGSPILSCLVLRNPGYWLVMRANSLTSGGVIQIAAKSQLEKELSNPTLTKWIAKIKTNSTQAVLMFINLALIIWCAIVFFK